MSRRTNKQILKHVCRVTLIMDFSNYTLLDWMDDEDVQKMHKMKDEGLIQYVEGKGWRATAGGLVRCYPMMSTDLLKVYIEADERNGVA